MSIFTRFIKNESGATAIEYSLIAALMATAIVTAVTALSGDIQAGFARIGATIRGT